MQFRHKNPTNKKIDNCIHFKLIISNFIKTKKLLLAYDFVEY